MTSLVGLWAFAVCVFAFGISLFGCGSSKTVATTTTTTLHPAMTTSTSTVVDDSISTFSVLMLGDWGGGGEDVPVSSQETAVISGMANVASSKGSNITLLLGDNFYFAGLQNDKRFVAGFEEAFPTSKSAFKNMSFYATAGNHDYGYGAPAVKIQIDYHQQGTGRWNYPDYDYTIDKQLPDGKKLRICMFDSVMLAGLSHKFENGTLLVANGPTDLGAAAISWDKLESCLDSDADYLFSAAHYPAYSGCEHGSVMEKTKLPGLLKKYNAHGHLAGHDHCLQHIERDGMLHVVTGAGSVGWYSYKDISGAKFAVSADNHTSIDGGFAELEISSGAKVIYYDHDGSVLYTSDSFPPRNSQELV